LKYKGKINKSQNLSRIFIFGTNKSIPQKYNYKTDLFPAK